MLRLIHASNIFKCSAAAVPCLYVRLSARALFLQPIVRKISHRGLAVECHFAEILRWLMDMSKS